MFLSSSSVDNGPGKLVSEEASTHGSEQADAVEKKVVPQVKEILLCLRPIRDGDAKADEAHRFKPQKKVENIVSEDNRSSEATNASLADGNAVDSTDTVSAAISSSVSGNRQKRLTNEMPTAAAKKKRGPSDEDIDSAVVESLMLMSNKKV